MKPPYIPLRNLTDKTKDYKVKVIVLHKSPTKKSTESPTKARFQKLVFQDEEGTKMHATLFNDEIESYEEALQRDGEYELSGATIQPVPKNLKAAIGEYQMNFNSRVKISPLNTMHCTDQPRYTRLSSVLRSHDSSSDIFDIAAIFLAIDGIKSVGEGQVRHLTVVDNSVQRPITLSAWNKFTTDVDELIPSPAQGLSVVGFVAVQKATFRGVSLKTTMSTQFVTNPTGPVPDIMRNWLEENSTIIHSWVTKSSVLKGSSSARLITSVADMEKRKPSTVWQEETFWINVSAPCVYSKDIFCYNGCSKCGRRAYLPANTTFKCRYCTATQPVTVPRMSFQFYVTDGGEGSIKVAAFGKEAEKILGAPPEEIEKQKNNEDQSDLNATITAVENKQMLLQIAPSSELTTSYVLKWIVRQVEATPGVRAEAKELAENIKVETDSVDPEHATPHTTCDA